MDSTFPSAAAPDGSRLNRPAAVEAAGLCKRYKGDGGRPPQDALTDLTLRIGKGSFTALLGPNGAGKSTFINILAGLTAKSSGSVRISGFDIDASQREARRLIGVVPQELNLDPFFTPKEALLVQAGLYGVKIRDKDVMPVLEAVGLADKADAYARGLSGGMRRRLLVAKAMVHKPDVLVLDEPTAGVDVELRRQLWAMLRNLNAAGTTIVLTTHYLKEAEDLCDRIAIIDKGRLIADESTPELLNRLDSKEIRLTLETDLSAPPASLSPFHVKQPGPRSIVICFSPSRVSAGALLDIVRNEGLRVTDVSTREAELEDVFLRLTQRGTEGLERAEP